MTASDTKPVQPIASSTVTPLQAATGEYIEQARMIRAGGGPKGVERQHRHGRLTARERI